MDLKERALEELLKELGVDEGEDTAKDTAKENDPTLRPATKEEVMELLQRGEDDEAPHSVGDICVWRTGLRCANYPNYGQQVVVTQVLSTPVRNSRSNTSAAECMDTAIAFVDFSDRHDEPLLLEALVDARRLRRVGSIFD